MSRFSRSPEGKPVAFHDIPADAYPFTIKLYNAAGMMVWTETVHGPGSVEIPGFGRGNVALTEIRYGDGTIVRMPYDEERQLAFEREWELSKEDE